VSETKLADKPVGTQASSDAILTKYDLTTEEWREYEWEFNGVKRVYHIDAPQALYLRKTGKEYGSTHRVTTADGVGHCVPAPGVWGCVIRWKNKDSNNPVNF
jgi:hypothetical protein